MPGVPVSKLRSIARNEHGTALLEFAFSAAVLFMTMFGIIDSARALYVYHFISFAAQQGSRYSIVRGAHWGAASCSASTTTANCNATATDVQNYVQSLAPPGVTGSNITVTTTWPGTTVNGSTTGCTTTKNADGCVVKVNVAYSFSFILPFLPTPAMSFSATSEEAIQE